MAAGAGGELLRPATIDEAAKARIGGGMLSGVSSVFLSAYGGPALEGGDGMDLAGAGRSQLQANADSAISAAQAAARGRRCRYARLVSCQLWCVVPRQLSPNARCLPSALPFTLCTCLWCAPALPPFHPPPLFLFSPWARSGAIPRTRRLCCTSCFCSCRKVCGCCRQLCCCRHHLCPTAAPTVRPTALLFLSHFLILT